MRILDTKTKSLPCILTDDEFSSRARALARACQDIESEESAQSQQKADMKARLAALEAERSRLTLVVSRKSENRDIVVRLIADDAAGEAFEHREDTGEVLLRRPLYDSERQMPLPMSDPDDESDKCEHGVLMSEPCAKCDSDEPHVEPGESGQEYADRRARELSAGK